MAQTQSTLITQVLQDLGAIGAGVTAEAADVTAIADRLAPIYADLAARRIYTVANTDALEDRAYPSLLRIVVETLAPTFGRPTNADVVKAAEAALFAFTRYAATDRASLPLAILETLGYLADGTAASASDLEALDNIVSPVLADLVARRITPTLTANAIPDKDWGDILAICVEHARPRFTRVEAKPEEQAKVIAAAEQRLLDRSTRYAATDRASLPLAVLERLGYLVDGGTPATADLEALDNIVTPVLADLATRRITATLNPAAIPDRLWSNILDICVERARPRFSRIETKADIAAAIIAEAEKRLLAASTRYAATDRTSLPHAVLERLGYLVAGTAPETDDLEALDNIITPVLADLVARRITPTLSASAIPDKYWNDILQICVEKARHRFSPSELKPELQAAVIKACEDRLYAITRLDRSGDAFALRILELLDVWGATNPVLDATVIEATYQGILDDLAARNIIYVADIDTAPESVKHHLVRIIAAQFLPKADVSFVEVAERMLRKQQRAGQKTREMLFPVDVLFQRGRRV
jgi:hypothetical protein